MDISAKAQLANEHLLHNFQRYFGATYGKAERDGDALVCGDAYGGAGHSFRVNLSGSFRGIWKDFNGGEHGDLIDLYRKLHNCSFMDVIKMVEGGGLDFKNVDEVGLRKYRMEAEKEQVARRHEKEQYAREIYTTIHDTWEYIHYMMYYMKSRGVHVYQEEIRNLGKYAPATRKGSIAKKHLELPACDRPYGSIIHPVRVIGLQTIKGIHRIHVEKHGNEIKKFSGISPKTMLGSIKGGAVAVNSLGAGCDRGRVIIGEGVENTIAWRKRLIKALPFRAYAALSCNNMIDVCKSMSLEDVRSVAICADPDEAGVDCAIRAYRALLDRGGDLRVRVLVPSSGKDALDSFVEKENFSIDCLRENTK